MEKYVGTNCTLFRIGNLLFLGVAIFPNTKWLTQDSIIATIPEVPFKFNWFERLNTPFGWVTLNGDQSGTIICYLDNKDIRIRSTITTNNNITSMTGLMVGYVGPTI